MNEPIINPWIFYLIDFVGKLHFVLFLSLVLGFGGLLLIVLCKPNEWECDEKKKWENNFKPFIRFLKIVILVCAFAWLAIPLPSTMYKMLITQQITPVQIEQAGETLEQIMDKAVDKIEKLQNKTRR